MICQPPAPKKLHRPLFCPICGARLLVELESTELPEIHRLPEHQPATNVNLCLGMVIEVRIRWDRCKACDSQMSKHPSGLCQACYSEGGS